MQTNLKEMTNAMIHYGWEEFDQVINWRIY